VGIKHMIFILGVLCKLQFLLLSFKSVYVLERENLVCFFSFYAF
jgi:hypothetical protein